MPLYRYLGTASSVGDTVLDQFGQQVQLSGKLATDAILGGCTLIPESDFKSCGFTEQDLDLYPDSSEHKFTEQVLIEGELTQIFSGAPPEFLAKKAKALLIFHNLRESLAKSLAAPVKFDAGIEVDGSVSEVTT